MVSSDTVVGIVGAVALAAVMLGVFVYEFNNAEPATPIGPTPEGQMAAFAQHYPLLNATQDLDGDGTLNFEDADMDGDFVNNTDDDRVAVTLRRAGTAAAATPPAATTQNDVAFPVHSGATGITGTLYYNTTTPGQLPGAAPVSPTLSATVVAPDGSSMGTSDPSTRQGTAVRVTFGVEEAPDAGEHKVRITASNTFPTMDTAFEVVVVVDYGMRQA